MKGNPDFGIREIFAFLRHSSITSDCPWQMGLIPMCGSTAAQTQRAWVWIPLRPWICFWVHLISFNSQQRSFFSSCKRGLNICFYDKEEVPALFWIFWPPPKNCNEISDSGRLVLFLLLKNRIWREVGEGLKELAHSIIERKIDLWLI